MCPLSLEWLFTPQGNKQNSTREYTKEKLSPYRDLRNKEISLAKEKKELKDEQKLTTDKLVKSWGFLQLIH